MTERINDILAEMRTRKVNNGKHTSPTLIAWADRIEAALANEGRDGAVTYEVWQNGYCMAGSDDLSDAQHYATMYSQDGPVELFKAWTKRELFSRHAMSSTPSPEGRA